MVFITLGTQGNQFQRCLKMVEELIDTLHPDQEFVAQLGNTKYQSDKIRCMDFVPETEFKELIGKADIVISSMTITEERKESVDFSDPYANAMLAILANKDSGISSVDDLNQSGKKIAVKTGSTGYIYAQKHLTNAEIVGLPDESACVTEVAQGKADGFIYDQLTIYRNWKKNPDTTTAVFIPFQDVEQWGVAVQKGDTELLSQLNEFIAKYREDGGFDQLTEKYLSEEKKAFDDRFLYFQ